LVHKPIVVLEARPLVSSEPHWYVRLIDPPTYRQLRHAPLTDEELSGYNDYLRKETVIDVFGRMLAIIQDNIIETANFIAA
jgi:hypothetical protein